MNTKKNGHILLLIALVIGVFISNTIFINAQTSSTPKEFSSENLNKSDLSNPETMAKDSISLAIIFPLDSLSGNPYPYPPAKRDFKKLGLNTSLFVATSVVCFGVLFMLPESVTQWDKQKMLDEGITDKWKENVAAGPVWDNDNFFFNYITHPYAGAVYYMTARSSGFKWYESFGYSAIMSTFFWEYGVEAFAEIPSWQDIIITPTVGLAFGEGFYYAKKSILKHDKRILKSKALGVTTLFLMDPFNTILDGAGYKTKTTTTLSFNPIGVNYTTGKPIWGANLAVRF